MLSILIPISERCEDIKKLYFEYVSGLDICGINYEIIFILDGPREDTLLILKNLSRDDGKIKIIQLSKWFGEATALTAGIEESSGSHILILPSYAQIDASQINKILTHLDEYDMVLARRYPRRDPIINRIQGGVFNAIVRYITNTSFKDLGCAVRAFKREVVNEISIYGDQHRFLPLLADKHGFSIKEVNVDQAPEDRHMRIHRLGVYPRRLMDIFTVFFLVKFTKKPLRFFGLIGIFTFVIGALLIAYIIFERLFLGVELASRPALLLSSLMVVLGVQIIALGLIGELIIFTHANQIKEYKIDQVIN